MQGNQGGNQGDGSCGCMVQTVLAFLEKKCLEWQEQYDKITFISPSSVLAKYLFPGELKKSQSGYMPIFPFGFNLSQKDFETFINEYPVILSTTHSLRSCASANYLFDYVIVDETSQVDIVTGALALSCARQAVIVGDLNRKSVSEYESENLINAVIEKVLSQPEFDNLDHVMHQPLKMLIRNAEHLDEAECRYAMNVLTHTDFVIFNKLDKMPVLVVGVDGYAFHANNPRQLERDKMKDAILQKYGIPILRLKTNESGEEARLQNKLKQVLNMS